MQKLNWLQAAMSVLLAKQNITDGKQRQLGSLRLQDVTSEETAVLIRVCCVNSPTVSANTQD
jgi:hypothetical protein